MEVSVSEKLGAEHHRLESLWKEARDAARGDSTAAFKSFADGLGEHIRDEEEVLFPAFEERTGMGALGGPTAVMRMEHRQLEEMIAVFAAALEAPAAAESESADALSELLKNHDAKEEGMLYPMIDRAFKIDEKTELLCRLDARRRA